MDAEQLISVIIPIYKVEAFLEECVDSIINQTYKNLEIILVDDGSPDKCPQICDEYAKKDNRIKVIHKQNGGLSDARNAGLEVASGDWISFVDSDDVIDVRMLETLINNVDFDEINVSCCGYCDFSDEIPTIKIANDKQYCDFETFCKKPLYITAWAKLYRTELFADIKFPVGKLHEDEFTTYKILCKSSKIAYTANKLYFYRQRVGSIISQIKEKNIIDKTEAYLERAKYFYDKQNYKQYIDAIKYLCQDVLCNFDCKVISNEMRQELKQNLQKLDYSKISKKDKIKIWLSFYHPHLMDNLQKLIWKIKGIK